MATRLELPVEHWRRISPKLIGVQLVSSAIVFVLAVVAALVAVHFEAWVPAGIAGVVAAVTLVDALFVPRRVRSYGYQLRDDDLLFRKGLLFQRFVAVPYGRMQLIDINRGPLARALGLSDLKLVTAASTTNIAIPGLTETDASELRDRLVELAETRRVGL